MVSRNAQLQFILLAAALAGFSAPPGRAGEFQWLQTNAVAQVVIVENPRAVSQYEADPVVSQTMVDRGLTNLTGKASVKDAWLSLVTTNDVVGIKVYSLAGSISGTRPAVVEAIARGLIAAGLPPQHVIIWDKREDDLRDAGFLALAKKLGVRAEGSFENGYDEKTFYNPETAIIGNLVWGDLEFGKKGPGVGRRSFVSLLVSKRMTKIISVAPLLNDYNAGVCGHLFSLALGSVDNTRRFENDPDRLAIAIPEIYALPALGDHVVLNVTDALIAQYEGGSRGLLQYSAVLNQLWFSRDPVALDTLALKELDRIRRAAHAPEFTPDLEIYSNAALLQLGVNDPAKIQVERLK